MVRLSRLGRNAMGLVGLLCVSFAAAGNVGASTMSPLQQGLATTALSSHELHQLANINAERVDPWCWKVNGECWHSPSSAKKQAIMFGDSHVAMWLPAVAEALPQYHVQVWWHPSCPVAHVTPWSISEHKANTECVKWRSDTLKQIVRAHPQLIIMAERTSSLFVGNGSLISKRDLTSKLGAAFEALAEAHANMVLIGDTPSFVNDPVACLALHRSAPLSCAIRRATLPPAQQSLTNAERLAATAHGVTFIDPRPWVCSSSTCPALLGDSVAYSDQDHFTASAVALLSGRFASAISPATH